MSSRSQLVAILNQKVLSGGRRTTAQFVRDIVTACIASTSNITDDANQPNGYAALNSGGKINASVLPSVITVVNINITGAPSIDLGTLSGTVYANLTSANASETIDSVVNFSGIDFVYFFPKSTLNVTFNDASVNGGNMKLNAPTLTPIGGKLGFLKLMQRNSLMFEESFIDQYV